MEERSWHHFYDQGVPDSLDFENVSLPEFLKQSALKYSDSTALIFNNYQLSYKQLNDQVDRFATALTNLGVTTNTPVAIQLPNLPQTIVAYYAVLSVGARVVMTNPLYVEREIKHQWNDAACTVAIVTDYLFNSRIKHVREELPIKHYIIASIPDCLKFPLNFLATIKLKRANPPLIANVERQDNLFFMKELIRNTPPNPPKVRLELDTIALLQYTGGTTGTSKGAMLTHGNLSWNVQQVRAWFSEITFGKEVILGCLPFFHVFGMTVAMNLAVSVGAAIVVTANPRDIPKMLKDISRHRVTLFPAVPAMFNAINRFPGIKNVNLRSVSSCFSGSAPLPLDVLETFEGLTGSKIIEGFGLTETSPVTHVNPLNGRRKIGSVGIPLSDTDSRIVSLTDGATDVSPNVEGELLIKGPQIMKGYWNQPDATKQMIRNGWLFTGDIAKSDADGYVFIVGRKKDMVTASGYNIYPDEIDRILMGHPEVLEAATIGLPDERRGETIKSFVVPRDNSSVTVEELLNYCKRELAAYKVPREIEFRKELPKSTLLKVLRRELRSEEIAKS